MCRSATNTVTTGPSSLELRLWPDDAPGALGNDPSRDVPCLTAFFPTKASGASVVICPGGGYHVLCADYEGRDYALWLNERGIAAFVLRYRLGSHGYRHPIIAGDLARAVRVVRAYAAQWHLDPAQIGVMGSSAGGHRAAASLTRFNPGNPSSADVVERVSSRPDFGILCYPVITMRTMVTTGFRHALLGLAPSQTLIDETSHELHVTSDTPPVFIVHTREDEVVPVAHAELFTDALRAQGVPVDLHIYQPGAHGIGLGVKDYHLGETRPLHDWTKQLDRWLRAQGLAPQTDVL